MESCRKWSLTAQGRYKALPVSSKLFSPIKQKRGGTIAHHLKGTAKTYRHLRKSRREIPVLHGVVKKTMLALESYICTHLEVCFQWGRIKEYLVKINTDQGHSLGDMRRKNAEKVPPSCSPWSWAQRICLNWGWNWTIVNSCQPPPLAQNPATGKVVYHWRRVMSWTEIPCSVGMQRWWKLRVEHKHWEKNLKEIPGTPATTLSRK